MATLTYTNGQEVRIGDLVFCSGNPTLFVYDIKDRLAIIINITDYYKDSMDIRNMGPNNHYRLIMLWENGKSTDHVYTADALIKSLKLIRRDGQKFIKWV